MRRAPAITLTSFLLLAGGCQSSTGAGEDPAEAGGDGDGGAGDAALPTSDAGGEPAEEAWIPQPFTATRFAVFYQVGGDVIDLYADPELGFPRSPEHAYVFAHSHVTAEHPASRELAERIHNARPDFKYAPCFDLNNHPGWSMASDAELATMAHDFRDRALVAHADFWCFNEAYSTTGSNENMRVHMMKLFSYLSDPAPGGARLRGILFLTESAATPSKWTSPGTGFWQRVNQTCDAVVAEHYHSQGYVCGNSLEALSSHLFAMRRWLEDSGDPDKIAIANQKFVVLHSARYAPGTSGWAGANSDLTSLAAFQRNLSRVALATRSTAGGWNRISFAPVASSLTALGVQPRIRALLRWHYGAEAPAARETSCIAGAMINCQCQ